MSSSVPSRTDTHYDTALADYQEKLTSAAADTAFVAKMQAAAASLKEKGYAVVDDVVEPELLAWAHDRFWDCVETASSYALMRPKSAQDLITFRSSSEWMQHKHGILEDGELAHMDFVHAIRLHPRVMMAFAMLYGAQQNLIVATDRINYQLPKEWLRYPGPFNDEWTQTRGEAIRGTDQDATWLHVDQSFLKQGLHCVQGLVVCVDADQPGDASLELVPGSHLRHGNYQQDLQLQLDPTALRRDWYKFSHEDKAKLTAAGFFDDYTVVHAKKGALILWDSRTAHQGGTIRAHATKLPRPEPRPRFVVYVCAQPARATPALTREQVDRKQLVFKKLRATSHWPLQTTIFPPPRTYGKELPVFAWDTMCVRPLDVPGSLPVVEQLYGLTEALGQLTFCAPDFKPLMDFAPVYVPTRAAGGGSVSQLNKKKLALLENASVNPAASKKARVLESANQ
jgi:ectoine hydroxylase-related dioxygenase (phytanoyl-CoA dioxygenase family)